MNVRRPARHLLRFATLLALVAGGARAGAAQGDAAAPTPGFTPRLVKIAEARHLGPNPTPLTVTGRAAVSSGVLQARAFEIVVADSTGAIRVFSRVVTPQVRAGDSVVVTGELQLYRGDLELIATAAEVIDAPPRMVIPTAIALDPAAAAAHAGQLVRVDGRVEAFGTSEGGHWLRLGPAQAGDRGSLNVWVSGNAVTPADLTRFEKGELVDVSGFVTAYRDNPADPLVWQLVPRNDDDVTVRGVPRRWYRRAMLLIVAALLLGAAVAIALRVSARRHARAAEETEERYRQLLLLLPDAVLVYADDRILFTNPAAARLLEVDDERSLVGQSVMSFLHPASRDVARPAPNQTPTDAGGVARVRGQLVGARGGAVDVEVATSPCRYHDRPAMVMLARDITEQLRHERDLHSLALRDELTGLHNRRGFTLLADQELARARRYGRTALLLFADLNGLKGINDEFGHGAGDEALRLMARALRSVVRESDVVARWGGDEFVALVFETEEPGVEAIGTRLNDALRKLADETLPFVATASTGMTPLDPENVADITTAIGRADADLYRRRQLVRNG